MLPDPARLFLQRSWRGALDAPGKLGPSPATGTPAGFGPHLMPGPRDKTQAGCSGQKVFGGEGIVEFGSERVQELRRVLEIVVFLSGGTAEAGLRGLPATSRSREERVFRERKKIKPNKKALRFQSLL